MISQLMILNKVLDTKNYSIITNNRLDSSYFSNYRTEFNFIKTHFEKYGVVPDIVLFTSNFPDFDLIKVSEPDKALIDQLFEDTAGMYISEQFNNIKKYLENGDVDKAKEVCFNIANEKSKLRSSGAMSCTDIISDVSRLDRYYERCDNKNNFYITTGLKELDDAIGGIDRENENMVIIARTGVGKTWTAIMMATAACATGMNVGFYSGEMSKDKVGYRFDTMFGHMNNNSITRGDDSYKTKYKYYIDSLKSRNCGHFYVLTPQDIGGQAKVTDLEGFIHEKNLDILFIDQYSLLEDTSGARAENEKIANISKAIKNLQVMSRIPIVSVSQQNRTKSESGEIDTTMVFGSDRIGQDATVLIAIDKKEINVPDKKYPDTIFNFVLLKVRDGAKACKLSYKVDLNTGVFDYIDENANMTQSQADEEADSYTQEPYQSDLPF